MLELIDIVFRVAGFLAAVAIAVPVVLTALLIAGWPLIYGQGDRVAVQILKIMLTIPLGALYLYVVWRIIRIAAGYTGYSTYPLEFVFRVFLP